jgi:hypothetical protein
MLADEDPFDGLTAAKLTAGTRETPYQRRCQLVSATTWHREAVPLPHHRQEPTEQRAARIVGRHVGVQGTALKEQAGAVATELFVPETPNR